MTDIALLASQLRAACTAAAFAAQRHPWRADLREAVDLLARVELEFPAIGALLWREGDGLPVPEDPLLAQAAARFLVDHPLPAAATGETKLWDLACTASRQLKCLFNLARSVLDHGKYLSMSASPAQPCCSAVTSTAAPYVHIWWTGRHWRSGRDRCSPRMRRSQLRPLTCDVPGLCA